MSQAKQKEIEDPFCVPTAHPELGSLDVVFSLDSKRNCVLAKIKFRSKVKRYLNKVKGAQYIKGEKAFYFPVEEINSFLKLLEEKGFSFAVLEDLSQRLRETAEKRAAFTNKELELDAIDLKQCLLGPYLTVDEGENSTLQLALEGYTTGQLRSLIPKAESFSERKSLAKKLSDIVLLELLDRKDKVDFKLWITKEAKEKLKERNSRLEKIINERKEKREKLLEKFNHFHSLEDAKLELQNKELEEKLFPHQRVAVSWLRETPFALLGDDMGLGKTITVLSSFLDQKERGEVNFLIVVCPNSLCKNWLIEGNKWLSELEFRVLPQQKAERELALQFLKQTDAKKLDALIVNYETLRIDSVYPVISQFAKKRMTLLCLDESQRAKNHASKTFQALTDLANNSKRRVLLSGTPTPRDLSDIWSQMYLLDNGVRFGTSYYNWLSEIAELGNKWSRFAIKKYKKAEVEEVILKTKEILLRRKKEEVLDLPDKVFSTRFIELKGEQKERYEETRNELLLRITACNGKSFLKEIQSILEEYLRAVQIASNPRLVDPGFKGEPAKFLELDEIVNEIVAENNGSLVIWTNYLKNVDELCTRYKSLKSAAFSGNVSPEKRNEIVKQFQEGEIKVLIAVPAAGGVGITLTKAQTAVYLDKTWNAEHWLQSVDRIHRIGQAGTVNIVSLEASKVDELIARNIDKKARLQEKLLDNSTQTTWEANLPSREELIRAAS